MRARFYNFVYTSRTQDEEIGSYLPELNHGMELSYFSSKDIFKLKGETYCKCSSIHTSRVNACVMPMGLMCTYIYYVRNFFAFSDVFLFLMYAFSFYHMGHLLDLKSPKGFTYYINSP